MQGLTKKQALLYDFIKQQIAETGVCPSYLDMCRHVGLKSKSGVTRLIIILKERGLIEHQRRRVRSIKVIDDGDRLKQLLLRRMFVIEANCPDVAAEIKTLL